MKINPDFDGVFRFTNATDEDFTVMWNNKEYTFLAQTTAPLIIQGEPIENIQEIRKKFAYKLAQREFYKSDIYNSMVEGGNKSAGGMPPLPDEKILEQWIEQCLKPLPAMHAIINDAPKDTEDHYTSKSLDENDNLNESFKDAPVQKLGAMPNHPIA